MLFKPLQHVTSHRLPNGLRVLLKEDHTWPLVSVQSWVRVGSIDESESEAGLAHVLEHMVFKGTARHAASDISRWVEDHGGYLNAETSKEYTHYYIDLPSSGCARAVHLMAQLLAHATIDAKEWAREKMVILEEMKRRHDDAETVAWELLQDALYANSAHARPVIGSTETVSALSADDVRGFYRTHYAAGNIWVVIAGDFKPQELLAQLRREFAALPRGRNASERPEATIRAPAGQRRAKKPVRQSYSVFGFPTPSGAHPDQEALDVLAVLLGDGRNARLVHTLREEKKLVWSVGTSNITQEGSGIFAVFAESDKKKQPAVGPAVRAILDGIIRRPPTAEEMRRAKHLIETSWLQGYETYHHQASTLGSYALEGQLPRLNNYLPKILKMTSRELAVVAKKYLSQEMCSAVVES